MKSLILLCTLMSSTAYAQVGVVGGGTLTNGAIVTGAGGQLIQTPCSNCTLNPSGDLTIPGILSVVNSGTITGNLTLGSSTMQFGAATTLTVNGIRLFSFDPAGSQGRNLFLGEALLVAVHIAPPLRDGELHSEPRWRKQLPCVQQYCCRIRHYAFRHDRLQQYHHWRGESPSPDHWIR